MTTEKQERRWTLEVRQDYTWRDDQDGPYRVCITPIDGDTDGGKDIYVENLRDARLIVAAPEMQGLLAALASYDGDPSGISAWCDEYMPQITALLARIDGAE